MGQTITYHVISDQDFDKKLKDIKLKQEESHIDRYYGVIVPTEWVAKIHNISTSGKSD